VEGVAAAEGVTTGTTARVEASGAVPVKGLALLGVGEELVGGLDVGEFFLGRRVLVGVGVVLFREAIVGLFDF
jgi:hypothetical protein